MPAMNFCLQSSSAMNISFSRYIRIFVFSITFDKFLEIFLIFVLLFECVLYVIFSIFLQCDVVVVEQCIH